MNEFYGLVYDIPNHCFREETIEGLNGIVSMAHFIADFTQNDEEPYTEPINTVDDAMNFLDLYDYEVVKVGKSDYEVFNELVHKNTTMNNRLSHDLEEEFYRKASSFKHEVYANTQ